MLYQENWPQIKKLYQAYWARQNEDRPLLAITAPKAPKQGSLAEPSYSSQKERWFDTQGILERVNRQMQNTYYGAEAIPVFSPNLGPDFFAALYGVRLEFAQTTSWAIYQEVDFDVYQGLELDLAGEYYQKMLELTRAAALDGRDKYLVGVTDIHAGADALVSLRGAEQACLDTLERPADFKRAVLELFSGFKLVYEELYRLAGSFQQGSTNWMNVWHPGRWYVTSSDFLALISNQMYHELLEEELLAQLDFLDASIFHLDGPDALRHLDSLLALDKLAGVQWVYGAGQPSAAHWLGVLQRIQQAGKLIQVHIVAEDLPVLLENLRPEGVLYSLGARSPAEAEDLVKLASSYKKSLF